MGQKRLGPRQFGGSKIAFAEIQGVATQRLRLRKLLDGLFRWIVFWALNWGHGEVL